jgi:hypothetical protein
MPKPKLSDVVGDIVDLLKPFSPDDRTRVIHAALTLLGDATSPSAVSAGAPKLPEAGGDAGATSPKAKMWQKQQGITAEQLSHVFHDVDGKMEIITGEIPGKNNKEKTLNAYVLTGIASLLGVGEPKFIDKDARAVCTRAGAYNPRHHGEYVKERGNLFTGSKENGWTLTAPGLTKGAVVIKSLAPEQE